MKLASRTAIQTFGFALTLFAATLWASDHEGPDEHKGHGNKEEHSENSERSEHGDHGKHSEHGGDSDVGEHEGLDEHPWHHGKKIESHKIGTVPNAAAFGKHVYFGGQPSADDLKLLAKNGVKAVINLRTQPEIDAMDFDEKAAVESHGMTYLNVPVGRDPISDESLKKISKVLEKAGGAPVLMHCKSGNRVGYVWSLYRGRRHGLDAKAAMTEGKSAGMKSEALAANARKQLEHAHHN